jgi:deoxyribodipyrimidine photo-lyase
MSKSLCWIRRDIRLHDHAALSACTKENEHVYLAFIFDDAILEPIKKKASTDKRVHFICDALAELQHKLATRNTTIIIRYGNPVNEIPKIIQELEIDTLYFNRDYSPYALKRDHIVTEKVVNLGRKVFSFKDHVIFEPTEILTQKQTPYTVFTPYANAWKTAITERLPLTTFPVNLDRIAPIKQTEKYDTVESLLNLAGFQAEPPFLKGGSGPGLEHLHKFETKVKNYENNRDYPHLDGTSKLSVYLRHGCISIRDMVNVALNQRNSGADKWLMELIWREFYQTIFFHFPEVNDTPFQEKFRDLVFPTSEEYLEKFKQGQTGFPLIDAAMRCLNQTGWMHNRLRMVTSSFLCKILLVDWKRGERYFSWKLLDYELQSNNGGWQWSAGIGCDAAPYFRIFNPTTQSKTYDAQGSFIRKYCPELAHLNNQDIHEPSKAKHLPLSFQLGRDYPFPIVDYKKNRQKAIELYTLAAKNKEH